MSGDEHRAHGAKTSDRLTLCAVSPTASPSASPEVARAAAKTDLPLQTRRFIEQFHAKLEQVSLFELLGVDSDAGLTTLRRAYFRRSKQFHPDRFYNWKLGPYQRMLERIFRWLAAAFKLLKDDENRALYRQRLRQAQQAGPQQARTVLVPIEREAELEFLIADDDADDHELVLTSASLPSSAPIARPPTVITGTQHDSSDGGALEFIIDD